MALLRQILVITYDQGDTFNEKKAIQEFYAKTGYKMISELKINETGVVKEVIMQSPIIMGKIDVTKMMAAIAQKQQQGQQIEAPQQGSKKKIAVNRDDPFVFNPAGGIEEG